MLNYRYRYRHLQELATAQCIYAYQLRDIGVIDEVIWETAAGEDYTAFAVLAGRIAHFVQSSLEQLGALSAEQIVQQRYAKFRSMGTFALLSQEERLRAIAEAQEKKGAVKRPPKTDKSPCKLVQHLAQEIVTGTYSRYRGLAPLRCPAVAPAVPDISECVCVRWREKERPVCGACPC